MHKISYVSLYDATDVAQWSGLGYYIAQALEKQSFNVDYIGNLSFQPGLGAKLRNRLDSLGLSCSNKREISVFKNYARQIEKKLSGSTEIIFSPSTLPIAFLNTNKPIVIYTDATLAGMLDYYPEFSSWSKRDIVIADSIEQKALEKATLLLYASDWAAQSAINNYNINPDKVYVVPFGANIELNLSTEEILKIITYKNKEPLNLLFIGVDWVRKGGNKVLDIVNLLNEEGVNTVLHIVGPKENPVKEELKHVVYHGFLDKKIADHSAKIQQLLLKSHFFIMLSEAECYGLVYCEANAYGLPVVGENTGGVETIIKHGKNGLLLAKNSSVEQYVSAIKEIWLNPTHYLQMAQCAHKHYQDRLNWDIAGKTIRTHLYNHIFECSAC